SLPSSSFSRLTIASIEQPDGGSLAGSTPTSRKRSSTHSRAQVSAAPCALHWSRKRSTASSSSARSPSLSSRPVPNTHRRASSGRAAKGILGMTSPGRWGGIGSAGGAGGALVGGDEDGGLAHAGRGVHRLPRAGG